MNATVKASATETIIRLDNGATVHATDRTIRTFIPGGECVYTGRDICRAVSAGLWQVSTITGA